MKYYDEFHDGDLEGLLIDGSTVQIFLSTIGKEHFVFVARGVVALAASGFRQGNIILGVVVKQKDELMVEDIMGVYELSTKAEEESAPKLLGRARDRNLIILEINPSYGATCLLLCQSLDLLHRKEEDARREDSGGPGQRASGEKEKGVRNV